MKKVEVEYYTVEDLMSGEIKLFNSEHTAREYVRSETAVDEVGDPCTDARRACVVGDKEGERLYSEAQTCCGFYDKTIVIDNVKLKIGFNYGH